MFIEILNYKVFRGSKNQCIDLIRSSEKINIISGNPEILYNGLQDSVLFKSYTDKTTLIIPDGIGTILSAKILRTPVSEKIAGIEVMDELIKTAMSNGEGIYLLGAKQETVVKCAENLKLKYKELNVLGYHNGYFDIDNCEELVTEIKGLKPKMIFVAMGCPRQELFISKYMDMLPCSIFMGVGGSFDIIAGNLQRAPKWMIKLGLEWLYRVVKEPFRIKRLFVIPKFLLKVIKDKRKKNEKNN
ncbi:N-acetylglucosaminyldiphosphoundecaprenol N-acetyl-beta-D-mannosaminyltransferase [Clostridium cavendishii DSM 21758]|uniref:N-acetylglucosaminyldiphosphoundecaprenol N-acetyl-beta-D-mannosaminyltransferase n=1 Tax=Clostridium cavendishii DSM 21758 TaxID=1121302 RepID=A0A1M6KR83_9CLOT|nr:WecB/TagA/CpsF family glycosyltransferase [Clostridium cavendishii]SHJ61390.1 N-acetylglucosaminyldiphosphoundecaprenol N-acetyl-beta-D-mannosaminyltransferase [Clostridium cavendishii DSM 21758]